MMIFIAYHSPQQDGRRRGCAVAWVAASLSKRCTNVYAGKGLRVAVLSIFTYTA
jgi:hypothetical protein